jgi:phosphotransferase system  glucose/maltose/N-acetylglucosamine-specific IIC component
MDDGQIASIMAERIASKRPSVLAMGAGTRLLLLACIPVALIWLLVMWALWP